MRVRDRANQGAKRYAFHSSPMCRRFSSRRRGELGRSMLDRPAGTWSWWLAIGILIPAWLLIGHASGLYRMSGHMIHVDLSDEIGPTIVGVTAWTWCFATRLVVA